MITRATFVLLAIIPSVAAAQPVEEGDDLDVGAAPVEAPVPEPTPEPAPPPVAEPAPAPVVAPVAPEPSVTKASTGLASLAQAAQLDIKGFIQAQGQTDQQSQDQLMQGGAPLNRDGFVVRRARIGVGRTWSYAAFALELDANTVDGAAIGLRRAEATLLWPGAKDAPPIAALTGGLSDIPFGYELPQSSQHRVFMERSTASLALFPGEADVGVRAHGGYQQFRYAIAVLAGEPMDADTLHSDPNASKDIVARVGIDVAPSDRITIAGGVSIVAGKGFHAGRDATKDSLEWRDLNENGGVELGELFSVPGMAATPSENFSRWGLGADVRVGIRTPVGWTQLSAEVTVASNLDRGWFVADPIAAGSDLRHLGAYIAAIQDVGRHAFGGLRFDYYDPNLDAFDSRSGMLIPRDETISTLSALVGVRLPPRVRAGIQYDLVLDNLARDPRGVPTDLANNRITARLQVDL